MRVYPKGVRISSSNLDPSVFWRKGVQMVALNWQSCDEGMMLNEGMFAGEEGWALKPPGYRSGDGPENRATVRSGQADAVIHKTLDLTIVLFAAQDIPLPNPEDSPKSFRPYVKCELHVETSEEWTGEPVKGGGKAKEGQHKRKTTTKKGPQPDFGGDTLQFLGVTGVVEELSFLR